VTLLRRELDHTRIPKGYMGMEKENVFKFKVGDVVVFERGFYSGVIGRVISEVNSIATLKVLPIEHWDKSAEHANLFVVAANVEDLNLWDME